MVPSLSSAARTPLPSATNSIAVSSSTFLLHSPLLSSVSTEGVSLTEADESATLTICGSAAAGGLVPSRGRFAGCLEAGPGLPPPKFPRTPNYHRAVVDLL